MVYAKCYIEFGEGVGREFFEKSGIKCRDNEQSEAA